MKEKKESKKGILVEKNEGFEEQNGETFLHNSLSLYTGLDLRTNPFEERENDAIKSSLSMCKETFKKMH